MDTLIRILTSAALFALIFGGAIFILQDFMIFPRLSASKTGAEKLSEPPAEVEQIFLNTPSGNKLEVWRVGKPEPGAPVVIHFNGNGGTLEGMYWFQKYFEELGYTNYVYEYRGYGRSTGWPSESGFYEDAKAVWEYILTREGISSEKATLFAHSIGSGPAAWLAKEIKPGKVILMSPFTSLKNVASEIPIYKYFTPLMRYSFPVLENLKTLDNTKILITHGKRDGVIPFHHSVDIAEALKDNPNFSFFPVDEANHDDVFRYAEGEIREFVGE